VHARERSRHVPAGDGVTDSERRFQTRSETVPGTVAERGSRKQPSPDVRFTAECVGDDAHEARAVHTTRTGTAPYIRLTVELPCDPRTAGKSGAVRRSSVRDETASCASGHTSVWPAGSLQRLGLSRVQSLEERPSPLGNRLADDELTAVDDALRLVCTAVACVTAGGETDLDRFDPITEVEFAVQLVPRGDDALVERIVQHPPGRACRCLADARPRRAHVGGCRPERALHRVESAADRAE